MKNFLKNIRIERRLLVVLTFVLLIGVILTVYILQRPNQQKEVSEPAKTAVIGISTNGFRPETITVDPGTKIIWINDDEKPHQIAVNAHPEHNDLPGLKSELLNNTQSYEFTIDKSGSYGYHDELNPTVNGTIEVR